MSKLVDVKSVVTSVDGLTTSAKSQGGHELIFDQSEQNGGNNKGMTPGDGLLAAIGACKMMSITAIAKKMRLELDEARVEVTGTLEADPEKGNPVVFTKIHADYILKTDAPEKDVKRLVELAEFGCVVGNTVAAGATSDFSIK